MTPSSLDILIIAPTPFFQDRGCHLRIREEAKALQKAKKSVLIATFGWGEDVKGLTVKRPVLDLISFDKGPAASWKKIPASIFLFFVTVRLIFKYRPEVIYCHLLEGLAVGLAAFCVAKIFSFWSYRPVLIFDSQGSRADEIKSYGMTSNSFVLNFFQKLEILLLRFPDKIFVSSTNYLEKLKKIPNLEIKAEQLSDGPSFTPRKAPTGQKEKIRTLGKLTECFEKKELIRLKKWLREEKFIVIYTGSFSPAKGLPDFVKQVLPKFTVADSVRFIFAGSGKLELEENESVIVSRKLKNKSLKAMLSLADLGIDSKPAASSESSGKLINYMAAGLPVLAIKSPNSLYFVNDENQLLPGLDNFKEGIIRSSKNKKEVRSLGIKNLRRINQKFAWDLQIRKILAIINHR